MLQLTILYFYIILLYVLRGYRFNHFVFCVGKRPTDNFVKLANKNITRFVSVVNYIYYINYTIEQI